MKGVEPNLGIGQWWESEWEQDCAQMESEYIRIIDKVSLLIIGVTSLEGVNLFFKV